MEPIQTALSLKEQLDSLRPISKEQELKIMQKFRLDWNYHSNNLEGNSLSYGETKALILFGLTAQGKPLKDHLEIEGHNEALEWIIDVVKGGYPLTESFIREIHTLLLKQSYNVDAVTAEGLPTTKRVEIGRCKTQPNHVLTKTGEIFRFASPEETPALMGELIDWYRKKINLQDVNPILLAAEFHYKFIRIHPFDDGNGRTARILMNFILMQFDFPPVIIKTQEKNQYFAALQLADSGMIEAFVNYIAANLVQSLEMMIRGAKGESIEDPNDLDKELSLLELRLRSDKSQKTSKSADVLLRLYDSSIVPLFEKYLLESRKFDRFYIKSIHYLRSSEYTSDKETFAVRLIRDEITINSTEFGVASAYKTFTHSEYGNFDFLSTIDVMLGDSSYTVMDSDKKYLLEKDYEDQLTEEEVNKIVAHEMRRHKLFIESKIQKN